MTCVLFAIVHAGLGDKEALFSCFDKAYDERSTWLCLLRGDARFDSFRSDPRFEQLAVHLGLNEN